MNEWITQFCIRFHLIAHSGVGLRSGTGLPELAVAVKWHEVDSWASALDFTEITTVSWGKENMRRFYSCSLSASQVWVLGRHCAGGSVSSISPPVQVGEESTDAIRQGHHSTKELNRHTNREAQRKTLTRSEKGSRESCNNSATSVANRSSLIFLTLSSLI